MPFFFVVGLISSPLFIWLGTAMGGKVGDRMIWAGASMFVFWPVLGYLRFVLSASRAILVTDEGISNATRSGKTFSILWREVNWAHLGCGKGQTWWTITTSTGHRLYFTDEGLTTEESMLLQGLIRRYIPDLPWRKRRWIGRR